MMSLIRVPSEFCHSFKGVCECLIKEGDDQMLYDYVTSLRGCDCHVDQKEYVTVKHLLTSVLRGDNDGTGGMDITNTIELFSNKETSCSDFGNVDGKECAEAIEYCSKQSGHYMLHAAWGFRALGTYYESVAGDRLCAIGNDDVALHLQNAALNCKSIEGELQSKTRGTYIIKDIYELVTSITTDVDDDEDERIRWMSSKKFKEFME
jgi:hypothetical protein